MRRIIKASMEDISSMERFQFSLRCAVCGSLWESQPVRFSKAGMQPESEGKRVIFQALYQREWEDAFERAGTRASELQQKQWSISACARSASGWFVTAASFWGRISTCVPPVRRFCKSTASRWKVCPRKTDDKGRRHR